MTDPLSIPGVVAIELTGEQAEKLRGAGDYFVAVMSVGTYPATTGRWCIFAKPVDKETAERACRVALSGNPHAPVA